MRESTPQGMSRGVASVIKTVAVLTEHQTQTVAGQSGVPKETPISVYSIPYSP